MLAFRPMIDNNGTVADGVRPSRLAPVTWRPDLSSRFEPGSLDLPSLPSVPKCLP